MGKPMLIGRIGVEPENILTVFFNFRNTDYPNRELTAPKNGYNDKNQ